MSAGKVLGIIEKEIKRQQRWMQIVCALNEDLKAYYVIGCAYRYSARKGNLADEEILVRILGFNLESVIVEFLAGVYAKTQDSGWTLSERLNKRNYRGNANQKSIKFDEIVSWKKVPQEDLPMYVGATITTETLSKLIKGDTTCTTKKPQAKVS